MVFTSGSSASSWEKALGPRLAAPSQHTGSPGPAPSSFPTQTPQAHPRRQEPAMPQEKTAPRPPPQPESGQNSQKAQEPGRLGRDTHPPPPFLPPQTVLGAGRGLPSHTSLFPTTAEWDPGESETDSAWRQLNRVRNWEFWSQLCHTVEPWGVCPSFWTVGPDFHPRCTIVTHSWRRWRGDRRGPSAQPLIFLAPAQMLTKPDPGPSPRRCLW